MSGADRRKFLQTSAGAAGMLAAQTAGWAAMVPPAPRSVAGMHRHRFGVNYTPSHRWWFCWADWDASPMQKDLDAIAGLGADHLRIMLIWPYFQPNLSWVDSQMLDRLSQLLTWMEQRHLDALITVFTGQLSGWFFLPPFNEPDKGFFTGAKIKAAQSLLIDSIAKVVREHSNVIGLDLGNEINTCWSAPVSDGDKWMQWAFHAIERRMPGHLNVNGVDQQPWFRETTFSPHALVAQQPMPVMHCYPYWSGALQYGGPMDPPSVKLLAGMAALIRTYAANSQKPVWAGEFNTCIASLSEKQQAQWLEKAVLAAIDEGVNWFSYWNSHDLNRKFAFNPVEYTLGLLTNDGRVKDQGRIFQELARSYRGKPVRYPSLASRAAPTERSTDRTWQWLLDWMQWTPPAGSRRAG